MDTVDSLRSILEAAKYKGSAEFYADLTARHEALFEYGAIAPVSLGGIPFLKTFNRIVVGAHGPYVEFERGQCLIPMAVAPGQDWRVNGEYHIKYHHLALAGFPKTKIYHQVQKVEYADYKVGMFYIDFHTPGLVITYSSHLRTIIAGSRTITNYHHVEKAIALSGFKPTEIVSGTARGVDQLGEIWAKNNNIPVAQYPADWDRYGKSAGYRRNEVMAKNADALIAVWDGSSKGTVHMIELAKENGLKVYVHTVR